MNAVPAAARRRQAARSRVAALSLSVPRTAVFVLGLVVVTVLLRTTALHARYWIDEGLSVGIAQHGFFDIPSVLQQDGSPPLYYLLLHVWTSLFGIGEARTHALSVVFAVATVPVGYALARLAFGLRAGLAAAMLFALNPFLTYYAQETRMYALMALLSLCVAGTFTLAFALRRRAWRWPFAAALVLVLYTHNWGIFLALGVLAALGALAWTEPDRAARRSLLRDAAPPLAAAAVAYLPWVPSLVFQARNTAAPWAEQPHLSDTWTMLSGILDGSAPAMAFGMATLVGVVAVVAVGRPQARRALSPDARALVGLAVMLFATVGVAWLASQPNPAWSGRYLTAVLGPLLLLGAAGLARAGWLGILTLVLLAIFWADPRTAVLEHKSIAHRAAVDVRDQLRPGDLVVAAHPEYGPTMHIYLPPGLRWANIMGPVRDPLVMDWRNALGRLRDAHPKATADPMIRSLKQGRRLLLVMPLIRSGQWGAPWTELVRRRALQWERLLDRDTRLVRALAVPRLRGHPIPRGVRVVLYERVPDGTGGPKAVTRPDPGSRDAG